MTAAPASVPDRILTVVKTEWLSPAMVRVIFTGDPMAHPGFSDTYIKLVFVGVRRAYTVRWVDGDEFAVDFVVHGDEGLAGPWAASAVAGDQLTYVGPGGDWSPRPSANCHLFVGDESALPAIASGLDALLAANPAATALVFAEVATEADRYPLPLGPNVRVTWVLRDGAAYGTKLVDAVMAALFPAGDVEAFVHGNAEMVRPLRRYLLGERGLPREHLSVSGYWRSGMTDEGWRASKRDFNAAMEAETESGDQS